ncbi:MAG: HAMP domain-containing sensor histidine kinase [Ignavibacteriales bacterium]|nr:HAMP domain-containing sensor histidine kinase [Ignavibacteriales bacterium]
MVSLVPSWAKHNDEFWNAIKKRNLWFIQLRYGAVVLLVFLLIGVKFILQLQLTETQLTAIISITICILIYNVLIHKIRPKIKPTGKFNNLHLSLMQMILDLLALTLLIYYSGGIENPLYMFYIFHMIIGSLILPGAVIYTIATVVVISLWMIALLEYNGILIHHGIAGLFSQPIYTNHNYLLMILFVFTIMMYLSVAIANRIAHQLYQREQQLRESLNKLNEAEKAKQRYVIGVVHEIKTPIAAVESFIELILKNYVGPISKEVEEKLLRVKIRTNEAIKMINNVLHISKLKLLDEIYDDEINIVEIVEGLLSKQNIIAESKDIKLEFEKYCDNNSKIFGDAVLLELALSNIINNALKYVSSGGRVEISLKPDGDYCLIEVCDNGIGIPETDQKKIFEEFYRASNIKHKGYEGTGLGLSLVNQIVKRHNGNITVQSPSRLQDKDRPGTCFTIKIPVKKLPSEEVVFTNSNLNLESKII